MASRLKKDATIALSGFLKFFSQDNGRRGMVIAVQKYIADLRHSISNLKISNEEINGRIQAMGRYTAEARTEVEETICELRIAKARIQQLTTDVGTHRRIVLELEKRLSPPETQFPSSDKIGSLLNALRKAFRVFPHRNKAPPSIMEHCFAVNQFLQHDLGDSYALIGKFVALETGIGHDVGFLSQTTAKLGNCTTEKVQCDYVYWMRNGIDYGKQVELLKPDHEESRT